MGQTFMGTCHMQGTTLELTRRPNFSPSWNLLLNWKMTCTTPGKIGVGTGAGQDTLKGLMSLGVELRAPGWANGPAPYPLLLQNQEPHGHFGASFYLPTSSCNPSQIEHKPQHFARFVSAHALELYTEALIVSLKTI